MYSVQIKFTLAPNKTYKKICEFVAGIGLKFGYQELIEFLRSAIGKERVVFQLYYRVPDILFVSKKTEHVIGRTIGQMNLAVLSTP